MSGKFWMGRFNCDVDVWLIILTYIQMEKKSINYLIS